jgi:hypothetical protein
MPSSIVSPFPVFNDLDGAPLENGYIYIGQSNLNPETAPVNVFWDAARTIPAPQPIRTIGGFPSRNGSPSNVYVENDTYSITVRNSRRVFVYSAFDQSDAPSSVFDISTQVITATSITQLTFTLTAFTYLPGTDTLQVYRNGLRLTNVTDYVETNGNTVTLTNPPAVGDEFLFQGGAVITGDQVPGTSVSFIQAGTGAVTRNMQDKVRESVSVLDFGADPTGGTDSTLQIQAAIDASESISIPKGIYKISALLNTPSGRKTYIYGDGAGVSVIKQAALTAGGIKFNLAYAQGGGIDGLTITSNVTAQAAGSTGIGLHVVNANDSFVASNFEVLSFDKGIRVDGSYQPKFQNFRVLYFTDYGINLSPYSGAGTETAGSSWREGKISNFGFSGVSTASVGILIQQASGEFFDTIDVTTCNVGIEINPTSSSWARYLFMTKVLGDTCNTNWIFDGTDGYVVANEFTQCWSSNSQGTGIIFQGANIDTQKWIGGWIRDSRNHGVELNGGANVSFIGTEVTKNSASAANTYDGIKIASNVSSFKIIGCRIGNVSQTVPSGTQRYNISIGAGTSNGYTICDNDLNNAGTLPINNASSGSGFCINNNVPTLTPGVNVSSKSPSAIASSSGITSGVTTFFGCLGTSTNVNSSPFYQSKPGIISDLWVACDTAPGAGQSFTYTVCVNGTPSAMTATISGASSFLAYTSANPVAFSNADAITVRLVTSAGAATANHRGYFSTEN